MLLEEAVLDIPALTGYVRELAVLEPPTLEAFLPDLEVDDIMVELRQLETPIFNVASYRAWDTAPPFGRRQGFNVSQVEIAPLGLSMDVGEREITRARFRGIQQFRQGATDAGAERAFLSLWDDALQCALATQLRVERARAELLSTGVIVLSENGLEALTYDPGVPAAHIVAAGTAWSDTAASTPVQDLKAWETVFRGNNSGRDVVAWLLSETVLAELGLNAEVRNLTPVTGVVPGIVTPETVSQVFRATGIRGALIPFEGRTVNPVTGASERLIDERLVIGLRPGGLGNTFFGTTASAEMLVGNGRLERRDAPGIVAWVEEEIRPPSIVTTAEGVALPILRDPNAVIIASV